MEAVSEIRLEKFESLFDSIDRRLITSNIMLGTLTKFLVKSDVDQKRSVKLEESQDKMRKQEDDLNKISDQKQRTSGNNPDDFNDNIVKGLGLWLGSQLLNARSGGIDLLVKGGLLAMIAGPATEFVGTFISESLKKWSPEWIGGNTALVDGLGETLADAGLWALAGKMIGKVFGKRIGMLIGVTGFLEARFDEWLTPENSAIVGAFDEQFGKGAAGNIGSVLGAVIVTFLPGLLLKGLTGVFKRVAFTTAVTAATTAAVGTGLAATTAAGIKTLGVKALEFSKSGASKLPGLLGGLKSGLLRGGAAIMGSAATPVVVGAGLSAAGLMIADEMQDDAYQFKTLEYNASKAALAGNPEEAARLMTQVENGQFKSEAMETPEYWKRKNVLENAKRVINGFTPPLNEIQQRFLNEAKPSSSISTSKPATMISMTENPKINQMLDATDKHMSRNSIGGLTASLPTIINGGASIQKAGDSTVVNNTTINQSPASSLDSPYMFGYGF